MGYPQLMTGPTPIKSNTIRSRLVCLNKNLCFCGRVYLPSPAKSMKLLNYKSNFKVLLDKIDQAWLYFWFDIFEFKHSHLYNTMTKTICLLHGVSLYLNGVFSRHTLPPIIDKKYNIWYIPLFPFYEKQPQQHVTVTATAAGAQILWQVMLRLEKLN